MSDMAKIVYAYASNNVARNWSLLRLIAFIVSAFVIIYIVAEHSKPSSETIDSSTSSNLIRGNTNSRNKNLLKAATWNIAAVNNNPFEYWITSPSPFYNELMQHVSDFIKKPGSQDIPVSNIFTDKMSEELFSLMTNAGWAGVQEAKLIYQRDYQNRSIISEFIRDGMIGKKRLTSMPDRVTNTITTADGNIATRPTVVNCYLGDMSSLDQWWSAWKSFMFKTKISVKRKDESIGQVYPYELLPKIERSKYPSLTEEEEKVSIPLETVALAVFDAILVNMMNALSPNGWQPLRHTMCQQLNSKKMDRIMEIISKSYGDSDIVFLQEVAGNFKNISQNKLISQIFDVHESKFMDPDRDQNSFILLKKGQYREIHEVTGEVSEILKKNAPAGKKVPVVDGDLIVLNVIDVVDKSRYVLASFHGDTNGLATIPVVEAVYQYALQNQPTSKLLFGMDANSYSKPDADQLGVVQFAQFYTSKRLNSCYSQNPNVFNYTTFHARTYLQPQLNKAITHEEKGTKGDKNLKDFIVFFDADFKVLSTVKDNTGDKKYIENMVFPTLTFPSDHGVTSTVLEIHKHS